MSRKRRQYSSDFRAKVALVALKGDQTTSELAAQNSQEETDTLYREIS